MHILLHGGTVVSAEGTAVLDVLIEDGRIAAVGEHLPIGDAQVVPVPNGPSAKFFKIL